MSRILINTVRDLVRSLYIVEPHKAYRSYKPEFCLTWATIRKAFLTTSKGTFIVLPRGHTPLLWWSMALRACRGLRFRTTNTSPKVPALSPTNTKMPVLRLSLISPRTSQPPRRKVPLPLRMSRSLLIPVAKFRRTGHLTFPSRRLPSRAQFLVPCLHCLLHILPKFPLYRNSLELTRLVCSPAVNKLFLLSLGLRLTPKACTRSLAHPCRLTLVSNHPPSTTAALPAPAPIPRTVSRAGATP